MTSEFYLNSVSVIKFFSTQAHVCYYCVSNGGKNATREVAAYTLEVACCDLSLFKTTNYVKLSHMLGGVGNKMRFTSITLSLKPACKAVCYQSEIEWGEVCNYIQSVSDGTATSCDKSLEITHLVPSTWTEIHL